MQFLRVICAISIGLFSYVNGSAQSTFTVSGYISDGISGETLIGANVYQASDPSQGATSNVYGYYSLTLPEGEYELVYSYLGYTDQRISIDLSKDTKYDIELSQGVLMTEVTISAEEQEKDKNVEGTQMGVVALEVQNIKKLPALLGEVDILKTLQLLPGVSSAGEGSSGFYVRGGGPDQNLVLLDEAIVYNTGHLLGFFSVFNADAIKNTTLIKGGMPANYGGRLSSVVDVQMRDGNKKNYEAEGGIGLISSRLTFEGPIQKNKSSFLISGRRTYALDLAQPALKGGDFEGTNYFFYDLNAKLNFTLSDKDRLYFSGYFGRDVLLFAQPVRDFQFELPYGNRTATLRWNHLFSDKLFFNLSAIYNDYNLEFSGGQADFTFNLLSGVRDYNLKLDFDYYPNPKHVIKYGANYTYHKLTPNTASASNGETDFSSAFEPKYGQEVAFYIQDDWKVNEAFSINAGLRYSFFNQLGPYTSKLDGEEFDNFEIVQTYGGLEPRLSAKYSLSEASSIKGAVTLNNQYIHLASNSSSTLPTDLWVPSTEIVAPQSSVQYALGYFQNFKDNSYEASLEVYYKDLRDQIDYSDDQVPTISEEDEDQFVFGIGRAYGAEFFLRKNYGNLTGWIGYTLSRTERSFTDIEDGRWYPAVYDRRHDISVVANYEIAPRLELGGAFVFGSGRHFTPAESFVFIENKLNILYAGRNTSNLPDYHRLDLSLTYTPQQKREYQKFKSTWNLSIYNVYNRKNPFFIFYDSDVDNGATSLQAFQVTIFPIIPSISWNFKWNQNPQK
jgi:hypothetical protein